MTDEDILSAMKEIQDAASERILIMTKQWGANVHFMRLWIKYLDVLEVSKKWNAVNMRKFKTFKSNSIFNFYSTLIFVFVYRVSEI